MNKKVGVPTAGYRVYKVGVHPKPKKDFAPITFNTRKSARHYCKARAYEDWTLVHPDGTEEKLIFI